MKNFRVTEKLKLQFRADLFNILNHPNFGNPDGGICTVVQPTTAKFGAGCYNIVTDPVTGLQSPAPALNANFGKVGQTIASLNGSQIGTGTARQTQFALKLMF